MVDVASRLPRFNPHGSDAHAYRPARYLQTVQISTDGFAGYPEAIDLAFGPYARHGVLIKQFRNARMEYTPSEMIGADRRPLHDDIDPFSICTSHVERHNLTVHLYEAVCPADALFLQEAREPRGRRSDVHRVLQLLLAAPDARH